NTLNNAAQISSLTTPLPTEVTSNYFDTMMRPTGSLLPDSTATTNLLNPMGQTVQSYGSRTYAVGYGYDAQGRMTKMTNWTSFAGNAGARVTTWNYDQYRGYLTSKIYDDGNGPVYSYSDGGRLAARLWARHTNTSYTTSSAGDLVTVAYND